MKIKLEKSDLELIERVNEPRERKRKLRPLTKKSKHPKINESKSESALSVEKSENGNIEKKKSKLLWISSFFVLGIISIILSQIEYSRCGLWTTYKNNFNKIVHGDEMYCIRELDPSQIIRSLEKNLVNQDEAIKIIQVSLNLANRERFISMVFSGSVGVGKTLSSNLIAKNFKWQENVNELIYEFNFVQNFNVNESLESDLSVATEKFKECGFNLVIIDDVPLGDESIERISMLERKLNEIAKRNLHKIVLIVIFRGNVKQDQLKNFVIVDFQDFTQESFNSCIERHLKLFNVNLKPIEIDELKNLNFTSSGCKTVAKKINLMSAA